MVRTAVELVLLRRAANLCLICKSSIQHIPVVTPNQAPHHHAQQPEANQRPTAHPLLSSHHISRQLTLRRCHAFMVSRCARMDRCSTTTTQHTGHNHRIDYTNRHVRARSAPPPLPHSRGVQHVLHKSELPSRLVLTVETCANSSPHPPLSSQQQIAQTTHAEAMPCLHGN
eukprot:COSAG01_NODE_312_length_19063_cov_207.879825_21_plen_171_part_00